MKSFMDRRLDKKPDFDITVHIVGVKLGTTKKIGWGVEIDGEDDNETAARILERAAQVLRHEGEEET